MHEEFWHLCKNETGVREFESPEVKKNVSGITKQKAQLLQRYQAMLSVS